MCNFFGSQSTADTKKEKEHTKLTCGDANEQSVNVDRKICLIVRNLQNVIANQIGEEANRENQMLAVLNVQQTD